MKLLRKKLATIAISIFFILSMTASMMLMPNASAHTPPLQIQLFAFCNAAPNPVGVGQTITLGFWLNLPPVTASGPYGDRYGGMMIHVTAPDGTNTTLGPFISDDTGGTSTTFTPTQTGTYTFYMTFPGETLTGYAYNPSSQSHPSTSAYVGDYILPATSNTATLTVQQTPLTAIVGAPLPTSYWQTPVTAMNVINWNSIVGPSLDLGGTGKYNYSSNYNPYSLGPTTSHIVWTKPEAFGGTLGGPYPASTTYGNYYSTSQYERKYNPVIINGYLYYNVIPGSSTTPTGLICVDLFTGQTVWEDSGQNYGGGSPEQTALLSNGVCTTLLCGQVLDFVSPNQFGGLAYLWTTGDPVGIVSTGTCLNLFDAETGTYILSVVNGTSPTKTMDANGDIIGYYVNSTAGTQTIMGKVNDVTGPTPTRVTINGPSLAMWNSTLCLMAGNWAAQAAGWEWRPLQDGVIPFYDGIQWEAPIATNYSGNALPSALAIWCLNSGVIVLDSEISGGLALSFEQGWGVFAGYSTTNGQQLWIENLTLTPYASVSLNCGFMAGNGIWTTITKETGVLQGFSLSTGQLVWTDNLSPFNPYNSVGGYSGLIAGSNLYLFGFGGDVWSINMANGKINWYTNTTTLSGNAGYNSPYGTWPLWEQTGIGAAGGVLFLEEGHEYSPPLFLGAQQLGVNMTTGQLIWSIEAFDVDGLPVTADGIMTTLNAYDNQIYAYGQGPSKTTVTAPNVGVTTATSITITGTVMDVSAGASQSAVTANFPNGLPCVSDASMSQFMEAVYMQQPMPSNITGVPVTLSVLDSNGNYRTIGTTTTNAQGEYGFTWAPDISGNYTVYATFAGTDAYYGSSASTYFYASSPPSTSTVTPAPVSGLASNTTVMYAVVALVIVFIVGIAIVLVVMTRKKP